jgi:muramidase (phage lysozyme)
MNFPQPPEGILDPKQPWFPGKVGEKTWVTLKAKLTGGEAFGTGYSSTVNLTSADADKLIENLKKDPRGYPQFNVTGGALHYENQQKYQAWLVEEYLEKPFRQQVDDKIDAKTENVLNRVFLKAHEETKEVETKEEVAAVIEDKVEVLESILEDINPPRSEYQVSDPWEGSYTTGAPQATVKKTKKKGRPKGSKNKTSKKKKTAPSGGGGGQPPSPPPKRSFATKMGGGLRKVGKSLGKSLLDKLEGGGPLGENMGPSVLSAGIWVGKKITTAFKDAKKEQERAAEAEANGAELPPETKEKGYFLKKALGYQFGGRVLDQTVGTFFENIPSKQSSKKAGFGDKFDYGDKDPKKKKQQAQQQSEIKDLASGFRSVTKSLGGINQAINQLAQTMTSLVGETTRVADILEAIQNSIAGSIDVEINSDNDATADTASSGGDINIGDINLGGDGKEGGLDLLDILGGVDDALDIANLRKKKKGLARQNPLYRKARKKGMPKMKTPGVGRFGMVKNIMNMGRVALSEGTGPVASPVKALVGEAGPEVIMRASPKKLAAGGVMEGRGSNILATGLGANDNNLMKRVQPFADVMGVAFQVIGAQISGALSSLVSAAGPFSGVIAKMFSPILGGLATIFGLNKGAFAAELNSAAMTEKQGAKELSKFFSNFFKLFGINVGGEDEEDEEDTQTTATGDWGPLLDLIASGEGSYDSMYPSENYPEVLKMSIDELVAFQKEKKKDGRASAAVGRYQMLHPDTYAENAGLKTTEIFTPANQDKMAAAYIENKRGGKDWREGKISDEEFGYKLAAEWAALKQPNGVGRYDKDGRNSSKIPWEKTKEALQKIKGKPATQAARGVFQPSVFSNQVQGVFELTGPDTGYRVPQDLTGGQPVIGHGLEWLIKMPNKFIILPGINKEYNVYRDPAKAFTRYEQIGRQGGVEVAGLVNFIDNLMAPKPTGRVQYGGGGTPRRTYGTDGSPEAGEIMRLLGGTQVRGASLPEGIVTPMAIPRDTVTGTTGTTVVAMVQPIIQYVPVSVPGPTTVEYVPANPFIAAKTGNEMVYLQGLS